MDIDEWRASVFGALSPVAITLLLLHRFGINLLDLFPYGSFRDGLYANIRGLDSTNGGLEMRA